MFTTSSAPRSRRNRGLLAAFLAAASTASFVVTTNQVTAALHPEVSCDFDADGRTDLATGAPGEAPGGGVVVNYNNQPGAGVSFLINEVDLITPPGAHESEAFAFGTSLACGDFNGDGVHDLAVGAPRSLGTGSSEGDHDVGRFYIFDGAQRVGLTGAPRWFTQNNGGLAGQSDQDKNDRFGSSLVAGDFDGDGHDDLAIGAIGDQDQRKGGSVTVAFGPINFALNADVLRSPQSPGVGIDTARFGATLASGNLGLSGSDDLVVGAPGTTVGDAHGRVLVYDGGVVLARAYDASSFGLSSAENHENFGAGLAVGDFNGNGFEGVAIGAPGFSSELIGARRTGAVFVAAGTSGGPSASGGEVFSEPDVGWAARDHDHFGHALAAVDLDGNGSDDLAVGAPLRDIKGVSNAGAVVVRMTSPSASGVSFGKSHTYYQGFNVIEAPESGDHFGAALAGNWFNGDPTADLVIGAPGEGPDNIWPFTGPDVGKVFIGIGWPSNNGGTGFGQDTLPGVDFGGSTGYFGDVNGVFAEGEAYGWAIAS